MENLNDFKKFVRNKLFNETTINTNISDTSTEYNLKDEFNTLKSELDEIEKYFDVWNTNEIKNKNKKND